MQTYFMNNDENKAANFCDCSVNINRNILEWKINIWLRSKKWKNHNKNLKYGPIKGAIFVALLDRAGQLRRLAIFLGA
jgi:hypothetical protein